MKISIEMQLEDIAKILLQHAREYGFINNHAVLDYAGATLEDGCMSFEYKEGVE